MINARYKVGLSCWGKSMLRTGAFIVGLSVLSGSAIAASTGTRTVTKIAPGASGDVFVTATGSFVNPNECTNTSLYLLPSDHAAAKELLATLLTGLAGGLGINLYVLDDTCTTIGAKTFATIFKLEASS